jgi:hypothetical protein
MVRDIDRGTDIQIRDESIPIQTPSLEVAGAELVPDELVRDLLEKYWFETEAAPKPTIVVKNEIENHNMARSDLIEVWVENYGEEFSGHRHEHVMIEVAVIIEIKTIHSRQRLWNLMAECRRVIYQWILALQPFHSLYFDGFQPDYSPGPGNYEGTVRIRLTADAIPVFKRRVTGEESPNTDPSAFPGGI